MKRTQYSHIITPSVFENIQDGILIFDKQWRYLYLNAFAEKLTGKNRRDLLGKSVWDVFPESVGGLLYKNYHAAMQSGKTIEVEYFMEPTSQWFLVRAYPSEIGLTILFSDITNRKQSENNLRFLAEASKILSSSLEYLKTLETVTKLAVPRIADWCSVDMLDTQGNIQLLAVAHKDPAKVKWAWELRKEYPIDQTAKTGTPNVLRTGKSEIYPLITDEMLVSSAATKKELAMLRSIGLCSIIISPIIVGKKAIGVISLVATETKRQFTSSDLFMTEELASRASFAIENARLYQQAQNEIRERKEIQDKQAQLIAISKALSSSLHNDVTLKEITKLIVPDMADYCRIVLMSGNGETKEIVVSHSDPKKAGLVSQLYAQYKGKANTTHGVDHILQTKKSEMIANIAQEVSEKVYADNPNMLQTLHTLQVRSYMGVPLIARNKLLGVITFSSVQPDRYYTKDDLMFAEEVGRRIAITLDNARLYKAAQESEQRFRTLIEKNTDAVTLISQEGKIIYTSPATKRILGYTQEEFKQIVPISLIHPDDLKDMEKLAQKLEKYPGVSCSLNTRVRHKNGTYRSTAITATNLLNDPTIGAVVANYRDTTQQREAESLTKRQAALLDQTNDAIFLWRFDADIVYWNKGAEEMYGFTPKEALGKHTHTLLQTIHPIPLKDIYAQLLKTGRWQGELRHRTKKNKMLIVETKKVLITEEDGSKYILETNRDITERTQMEDALLESEERLRLALQAGNIGVWDWDLKQNRLVWTDNVYAIHGVSRKTFDLTYENFQNLIHPEDKSTMADLVQKALQEKKPFHADFRIVTPKGEVRWVTTSAYTDYDSKGTAHRMLGATSDITEQKKLEKDRNDFVSIATHELKTPVTSLKAYAETLQRRFSRTGETLAAGQMGKMNAQLDKLTSLIADLLDATKIEAGKLQMHQEAFTIDELVAEITEEVQRTSEKHQLTIEGKTRKTIFGDRERIGQVLTNLLSNAIKYSPSSPHIIIAVSATSQKVQICVKDKGVGIPAEKKDHVFERFYRISGPKENTFPGLGLGLYISYEIIKRHKGSIWVESALGKGSTFCFALPVHSRNLA